MKKILIAVPCMDEVSALFAQSLAMLQKEYECAVSFKRSSLVYASRNALAELAVKQEFDYMMWFDSDMVFSPDTLHKLLADDKDIVSGIYFKRNPPYSPVFYDRMDGDLESGLRFYDATTYPEGVFEVAGIGFGCVLMKTDVLFDVCGKFGDWFSPIGKCGEDLSFCYRAQACGYKIWLDSRVKCGHDGRLTVTEDLYRAYKGEMK